MEDKLIQHQQKPIVYITIFVVVISIIITANVFGIGVYFYQQNKINKILVDHTALIDKIENDNFAKIDQITNEYEEQIISLHNQLGFFIEVRSIYSEVTEDAYLHITVRDSAGPGAIEGLTLDNFDINEETVPPDGCGLHINQDPKYFHSAIGGIYRITIETYGRYIGCSWLKGDYTIAVFVRANDKITNKTVTLTIPKAATKIFSVPEDYDYDPYLHGVPFAD